MRTLTENYPDIKKVCIYNGLNSYNFFTMFLGAAKKLGSARGEHYAANLLVGLNHGLMSNNDYLWSILDAMQEEASNQQ